MCQEQGIPHLINNAYGVQASKLMHLVNEAMRIVCGVSLSLSDISVHSSLACINEAMRIVFVESLGVCRKFLSLPYVLFPLARFRSAGLSPA